MINIESIKLTPDIDNNEIIIGEENENVTSRVEKLKLDGFEYKSFPVRFWDVFGKKGHAVRITISDMGPALLSRVLNLSEAGESILNVVFLLIYVSILFIISGIDKENVVIEKSLLIFGYIFEAIYIIYQYTLGIVNVYQYVIYLILLIFTRIYS